MGIETAFPLLYTYLVRPGVITLDRLVELICKAPRSRFRLPMSGCGYTVFDLDREYVIDPDTFLSMGKATPFAGWHVLGECVLTRAEGYSGYCKEERA